MCNFVKVDLYFLVAFKCVPVCVFSRTFVEWCKNSDENGNSCLVGGFKYFLFSPLPGEMIQFD